MTIARAISMIDAALDYGQRGWPVLPVHSIHNGRCTCGGRSNCKPGKHPRSAHGFQDATTDPNQIMHWWRSWPNANIAIPTGARTNTVVWDIDPRNGGDISLDELISQYGPLPGTVEAITGGGGRHLVFTHPGGYAPCRNGLLPGLDIKGDGGYFVVEPSLHISGSRYAWELSHHLNETPIAPMAPWMLELLQNSTCSSTEQLTERTEMTETTEPYGSVSLSSSVDSVISAVSVLSVISVDATVAQAIAEAMESTIPRVKGKRNDAVFQLARVLKAIPAIADAQLQWFRPIVRQWHRRAYPVIGTKPFEDTWADFLRAFPKVKFPKGEEPMARIFAEAETSEPPAFAADYESPSMVRLIKLCSVLQQHATDKPFFLSCRTAGSLLGIDHNTAAGYLRVLCADEILRVEKEHTSKEARRYRFIRN